MIERVKANLFKNPLFILLCILFFVTFIVFEILIKSSLYIMIACCIVLLFCLVTYYYKIVALKWLAPKGLKAVLHFLAVESSQYSPLCNVKKRIRLGIFDNRESVIELLDAGRTIEDVTYTQIIHICSNLLFTSQFFNSYHIIYDEKDILYFDGIGSDLYNSILYSLKKLAEMGYINNKKKEKSETAIRDILLLTSKREEDKIISRKEQFERIQQELKKWYK